MNQLKGFLASASRILFISVLALGLTTSFIGCSEDDDDDFKVVGELVKDGGSITGTQAGSITVAENATVTISGKVLFASGTTFKVGKGATIKADSSAETFIIIDRGAQIDAVGTEDAPIVFTSDKAAGSRGSQDWGGIVINGYATLNAGLTAQGEGDSGTYGGTDDTDDSGEMKYVRIEFAGKKIAATDELNCLALQGVGSATKLSYIQAHGGSDDGFEPFGGKVDLKYIVATGNGDDQFDGTGGWRGNLQFIAIATVLGDEGVEWDNSSSNNDAEPRTTIVASNVTVLVGTNAEGTSQIRVGTDATLRNFYINGNLKGNDAATKINMDASVLLEGGIFAGSETNWSGTPTETSPSAGSYTFIGANDGLATMAALAALKETAFNPVSGDAPAGSTPPTGDFFDASANYIGAVKNASSNWMANWTSFPAN